MYFNMLTDLWIIKLRETFAIELGSFEVGLGVITEWRTLHPNTTSYSCLTTKSSALGCWASGFPRCRSPERIFASSGPPAHWVTNPIWDCLGLSLWLLLAPVVRNHLLISDLIFFLAGLCHFSVVPLLYFIWNSFFLPRVYPSDVEEPHPSWGSCSVKRTKLS